MQVQEVFHNTWENQKADVASALLHYRDRLNEALRHGKSELAGFYKTLIVRLLCLKPSVYKKLSPAQVIDIANDLKFINDPWYAFHVTHITTKAGRIHRPTVKLLSLTFWQFIKADAEYSRFLVLNYRESNEQYKALDRLIAILYQPEPGAFDDTTIDQYATTLPYGLSFDFKYLILHTYSNCRNYIMKERCPSLFPVSMNKSDEPQEPKYTGGDWQNILYELAETNAFRGIDAAKGARLYDALDYLEKKAKELNNRKR